MSEVILEGKFPVYYSDKVEFIQKVLKLYSLITEVHLTGRDIDILTVCFIYNINDDDFNTKLIKANVGVKTDGNAEVMKGRLKKKGLLLDDTLKFRVKHLEPGLENLKKSIMSSNTIVFNLSFQKQ